MRRQLDQEMTQLALEVLHIIDEIQDRLHSAVSALVNADVDQAHEVREQTRCIDARCAGIEQRVYELIAMQAPVASDLRFLQSLVYISFNLERMSSHTRSIAKAVRRLGDQKIANSLLSLINAEASLVFRVLGEMRLAFASKDLSVAVSLPALDEPVDSLYKQFFREFGRVSESDDLITTRFVMTSRYLERISDNAVEIGNRLVFMFTGQRLPLGELSELTHEELNALYATVASFDPSSVLLQLDEAQLSEEASDQELVTEPQGTQES